MTKGQDNLLLTQTAGFRNKMERSTLREKELKALEPKARAYTIAAGHGLYLKVNPSGRKQWLLRKYSCGKAHQVHLGDYPALSLKAAVEAAAAAAAQFIDGRAAHVPSVNNLADLASDWLAVKGSKVKPQTLNRITLDVRALVVRFGGRQLTDISRLEFRSFLSEYIDQGHIATAHRLLSTISAIERHGCALGCIQTPVLALLKDAMPHKETTHHKSAAASELPRLLQLLTASGGKQTIASRMAALRTMVLLLSLMRSNEVRHLKWEYIDFEAAVITMPAAIMKSGRQHRVPVSTQLMSVLLRLKELGSSGEYVCSTGEQPLSAPYFNALFKRTGMDKLSTPHGLRAMARSWFADQGFDFAAAELCLAHRVENTTQQTYQRSDYLKQRRGIMQDWGDFVSKCAAGVAHTLGLQPADAAD